MSLKVDGRTSDAGAGGILAACGGGGGEQEASTELNIYMWNEYISDALIAISKRRQLHGQFVYMSDNVMRSPSSQQAAAEYDLICDATWNLWWPAIMYSPSILTMSPMPQPTSTKRTGRQGILCTHLMNYIYVVYDTERCPIEITGYNDLIDPALQAVGSVDGARTCSPIALWRWI